MLIRQQNAAILVTRKQDKLVFETFELSPLNSAVISVKGRLTRSFPGATVAVTVLINVTIEALRAYKQLHALISCSWSDQPRYLAIGTGTRAVPGLKQPIYD
jgi:hypothetical protein